MAENHKINFSENWNSGKLNTRYFTTIRMHSPRAYFKGKEVDITLKHEYLKTVVIVDVKTLKLIDIPNYICCLDTGYNQEETRAMVLKMYQKQNVSLESYFDIVLCKTIS